MEQLKKATTYDEQIAILKRRGTLIADEAFCKEKLAEINYYRFTAYFLPFRQSDGTYTKGTSFYTVYRLYEFDRKLRSILFSAVEEIEIYLRAKFAYFHAHKYGPLGYMKAESFSNAHDSDKFHETFEREVRNNSRVLFVQHHIEKYDGHFPIWVAVELFTMGMISRFYADLKTPDKKELARALYNTTPRNVVSWLRCVTDLRNICAHYGRLYYRVFSACPAGDIPETAKRRLWGTILAVKKLYPNRNKWNSEILSAIAALFEEYHSEVNLYHIAFPKDWAEQLKK